MQDKLVQVPGLLGEARLPIAALLACAELVLEERVVLGADDGEVVAHGPGVGLCSLLGWSGFGVWLGSLRLSLSVYHLCALELSLNCKRVDERWLSGSVGIHCRPVPG